MIVEARVKAALDVFGDPVEKSVLDAAAKGHPLRYYTFACDSFGAAFGDNEPGCERCLVHIHLFAPLNQDCFRQIRDTKRALFAAGFTWPQVTDATDQDGQHFVFECETAQPIEDDE
ncbi:MAG: hypothetical protein HDR88_06115 [Bacteroides sp.]|nr:hypothetical protein [Bacteroides sp.]MBD5356565.1 hypothetical protein [Bacteroides sp.]